MKVCLVANSPVEVAPYVKKYAAIMDEANIDYDIISKYHESQKGTFASRENVFFYKDASNIFSKFARFWSYAKHIKSVIKNNKYDRIVLFCGINCAFSYLVFGKILKKYKYIVDIRDYDNSLAFPILSSALKNSIYHSSMVVLSSERFKNWLPKNGNIYIMHNIPDTRATFEKSGAFTRDTVKIGYFGGIGYFEQNKAIVESLKDTDDIIAVYRGVYPDGYNIRDYCREKGLDKVQFFGSYDNSEKDKLYSDIDVINAVYGNGSLIVTTALPNKLYDAVYYKIPIMVNSGTYLSEIVEQYHLGFSVDPEKDDIKNRIVEYKNSFDCNIFEQGCCEYIRRVEAEQKQTYSKIYSFFEVE